MGRPHDFRRRPKMPRASSGNALKIFFYGLGHPPSPFLLRRLEALDQEGIRLITLISSHHPTQLRLKHGNIRHPLPWIPALIYLVRYGLSPKRLAIFRALFHREISRKRLIKEYLQLFAFDVDLIHAQWIIAGSTIRWLRDAFQAPVIITARGSQVHMYPFASADYRQQIMESLQTADAVHCVSESIRDHCLQLGAPREKTFVNYNGVDTDFFSPDRRRNPTRAHDFRMLTVGALIWRKNQIHLLDVLKILRDRGIPASLRILGDGPLFEPLRYYARRLDVLDSMEFLGSVDDDTRLLVSYRDADVYVHASMAEGLCNAVVEAQSCGLPVVAYEAEGMQEAVVHGRTGFVVPFGNRTAMAKALTDLYENRDLYEKMARNARAHIEKNFQIRDCVRSMIRHYRRILNVR